MSWRVEAWSAELDLRTCSAQEYRDAIGTLETEYRKRRDQGPVELTRRLDVTLDLTRNELVAAREGEGQDAESRLRVLDGYAEYLHTLQEIVHDGAAATAGQEEHR